MFGSISNAAAIAVAASSYFAAAQALGLNISEYFDFTLGLGLPSASPCSSNSLLQIGLQESLDLGINLKREAGLLQPRAPQQPPKAVFQVSAVAHVEANLFKVTLDFETAASAQLFQSFANSAKSAKVTGLGSDLQSDAVVVGADASTGIDNLFAFSTSVCSVCQMA